MGFETAEEQAETGVRQRQSAGQAATGGGHKLVETGAGPDCRQAGQVLGKTAGRPDSGQKQARRRTAEQADGL